MFNTPKLSRFAWGTWRFDSIAWSRSAGSLDNHPFDSVTHRMSFLLIPQLFDLTRFHLNNLKSFIFSCQHHNCCGWLNENCKILTENKILEKNSWDKLCIWRLYGHARRKYNYTYLASPPPLPHPPPPHMQCWKVVPAIFPYFQHFIGVERRNSNAFCKG